MPKHRLPFAIEPRLALRIAAVGLVVALPVTAQATVSGPAAHRPVAGPPPATVIMPSRPAPSVSIAEPPGPTVPASPAERDAHRVAAAVVQPVRALRPVRRAARKKPVRTVPSTPTPAAAGHYIRSLTGSARDVARMTALGAHDALRNRAPGRYLVLLDIGGQADGGVLLSQTSAYVSYPDLVRAMTAYVAGYHAHLQPRTSVLVAVGTNNDLRVNASTGRAWATEVVNPMRAAAARFRNVTVAGANDIEPGFSAGPAPTRAWLSGYLHATSAPFVFNGSADACYMLKVPTRCAKHWTVRDVAQVAGVMAPARTLVLPQVYNDTMAQQWAWLSQLAARSSAPLNIVGTLTENKACGKDPACPTMPVRSAWSQLAGSLRGAGLPSAALTYRVDLGVS